MVSGGGQPAQVESQQENRAGGEAGNHPLENGILSPRLELAEAGCCIGWHQGNFRKYGAIRNMNLAAVVFWQTGGAGGFGGFLIPLALMFGIMYFLVILPQQRQRKKVQEMLAAVKNGDKVITTAGIYGTISGMDGDTVILKIADNVKIRVARAAIAQVEASEDAK